MSKFMYVKNKNSPYSFSYNLGNDSYGNCQVSCQNGFCSNCHIPLKKNKTLEDYKGGFF